MGLRKPDDAVTGELPVVERAARSERGALAVMIRARERVRPNAFLNTTWRIGIFIVGWVTIAAGVVMLVVPGPGIAAIVVGFAILATEFAWAQHMLRRARRAAIKAKEQALDPRRRRRNQFLAAGAAVVAAAAAAAYLWYFGFALPWTLWGEP